METNTLSVRERSNMGKSYARKLRRSGQAPAIAYIGGNDPIHFELTPGPLLKILRDKGKNTLLTLTFDGGSVEDQTVMLRELQRDPVSRDILHADFALVDVNEPVNVSVKLSYDGRPIGMVQGGVADVIRRDINVRCLPADIPRVIHVDVTGLGLNQALHVGDVALPEGVEFVDDVKLTLVTITAPAGLVEDDDEGEEGEA